MNKENLNQTENQKKRSISPQTTKSIQLIQKEIPSMLCASF